MDEDRDELRDEREFREPGLGDLADSAVKSLDPVSKDEFSSGDLDRDAAFMVKRGDDQGRVAGLEHEELSGLEGRKQWPQVRLFLLA
jgi:hypothetical protein